MITEVFNFDYLFMQLRDTLGKMHFMIKDAQ